MFGQRKLDYLGHVVSSNGVQRDPSKVQAISDWPIPQNPKELRAFLGLTEFYRKFLKGYVVIATPLTKLLSRDAFEWLLESQEAFDNLKRAMTVASILALPDFTLPFALESNASGIVMGDVLHQQGQPIVFFSKLFCLRLKLASAYVRELHAITAAVRKWRSYLLGHKFTIFTDHRSLHELMSQTIQTP